MMTKSKSAARPKRPVQQQRRRPRSHQACVRPGAAKVKKANAKRPARAAPDKARGAAPVIEAVSPRRKRSDAAERYRELVRCLWKRYLHAAHAARAAKATEEDAFWAEAVRDVLREAVWHKLLHEKTSGKDSQSDGDPAHDVARQAEEAAAAPEERAEFVPLISEWLAPVRRLDPKPLLQDLLGDIVLIGEVGNGKSSTTRAILKASTIIDRSEAGDAASDLAPEDARHLADNGEADADGGL